MIVFVFLFRKSYFELFYLCKGYDDVHAANTYDDSILLSGNYGINRFCLAGE